MTCDHEVNLISGGASRVPIKVRLATDADLTLPADLAVGQVVQGVTLAADDRVLVNGQTDETENGVWRTRTSPQAAVRDVTMQTGSSAHGAVVVVTEGDYAGQILVAQEPEGSAVVGTDTLTFAQATGGGISDGDTLATGLTFPNTGLHILDTNASHDLIVAPGSDLTADRTLTVTTGDADRTLDISAASVTVSSFAATILDDADAAAVRTTIGAGTGSGDVVGPGSATDNAIARFDGTTGKLVQNSAVTIDDSGNIAGAGSIELGEIADPGFAASNKSILHAEDVAGITQVHHNTATHKWTVGQDAWLVARNTSGSTIDSLKVVKVTGSTGQRPEIGLADADADHYALGITQDSMANNAYGAVVFSGFVKGVDTSSWTAGTKLYLSQTAGELTSTGPTLPAHKVELATVIFQHAVNGIVLVKQHDHTLHVDPLMAIGAVSSAADKLPYFTDTASAALADLTSAGRALLDDANAAAQRTTLGLGSLATVTPTGTPDGTKFLRDDNAWTAIPGGGDALTTNPLSQFAATTSAQLRGVLSDETGTGAAVFAESPTLVTPALGTPSSGTLTNCTGLPQSGTVGLTTADSPQFTAINVGHASDTTLARSAAGTLTVEGNELYRAGGTDVPVADGGTGRSSHTAYAVLCGGTTTTAAQQSIASVGTSGQVLTSNGAGALPTFQTPAVGGGEALFDITDPVNGDWSWVNQGSASITTGTNGMLSMHLPADGTSNNHLRVRSSPSTPWTRTFLILPRLEIVTYHRCGTYFRDSAGGGLVFFGLSTDGSSFYMEVSHWSSPTGYSGHASGPSGVGGNLACAPLWLRIGDDATNRTYEWSIDGLSWRTYYTEGRTTHITANQFGWGGESENGSATAAIGLRSYT